jgi:hypothetical protein
MNFGTRTGKRQRTAELQDLAEFRNSLSTMQQLYLDARQMIRQLLQCGPALPLCRAILRTFPAYSRPKVRALLLFFLLLLALTVPTCGPSLMAAESQLTKLGLDKTNAPSPDTGWLRVPSKAVILDIHHDPLVPNSRHQASELTYFIIQELVHADYTVYLSPSFIEDEIRYYKSISTQDRSAAAILACLESATNSGELDWNCLRVASSLSSANAADDINFPWSQPPKTSSLVQLSKPGDPPIPALSLNMHWMARVAKGIVGFSSRFADTPQSVSGKSTLWNPSATLRLGSGPNELFRKHYPMQDWKTQYHQSSELPLQVTTLAILEDVRVGLKPKPDVAAKEKRKANR